MEAVKTRNYLLWKIMEIERAYRGTIQSGADERDDNGVLNAVLHRAFPETQRDAKEMQRDTTERQQDA